jgi:hypothetical protein
MSDSHSDKRRYPRLMREETLSIRPVGGTHGEPLRDAIYCSTVDMSAAGLQVRLDKPLPAHQLLDMWIAMLDDLGTYHLQGKVNWVRQEGEEGLVAGIQVLDSSEDLRGWQDLFN